MKYLRNPGGVESFFEDDEAAKLLAQPGWTELPLPSPVSSDEEKQYEDVTPADDELAITDVEDTSAPAKKSKKKGSK